MNMARIIQLLLVFSIVILNLQCSGCESLLPKFPPSELKLFQLSIAHINDFHARFLEVNEEGWPCQPNIDHQCFGGLPRTLTAARMFKEQEPNSIFLNAGDHYQGTIWYNIHKWNATVEFLNMLPHDVMTIGNHEFDDDISGLVPFLENVNVPVVLSNFNADNEPKLKNLMKKSHVIEKNGRKIGIIGVIFQDVWKNSKVGGLLFMNEIESINKEANKLKQEGVNIIIVLSHCGIQKDQEIAAACPDVDVIVGGHSHTFLHTGPTSPPYNDPKGDYPTVVRHFKTNRTVLIVQAFAFTKYLGVLSIRLDDSGEIVDWIGRPILLDNTFKEDENMLQRLEPYRITVETKNAEVVGTNTLFMKNVCRYYECGLGNMITDAMVASYVGKGYENEWTYAAIAINFAGAIKKSLKAGNVTYADLVMLLPFDDAWDVIEVQGKHLRQALEKSISQNFHQNRIKYSSSFVWSGIDVVVDDSINANPRVVEVEVRCQQCRVPKYESLKNDEWYRIVVPRFIVHNNRATNLAAKHKNHLKGDGDVNQLAQYIKLISPLNYNTEHRIFLCSRSSNKKCGKNYRLKHPYQDIFPSKFLRYRRNAAYLNDLRKYYSLF